MDTSTRAPDVYRKGFEIWLRTGLWPKAEQPVEAKFNPWHDPENGQFTFAGTGQYFEGGGGARGPTGNGASGGRIGARALGKSPRVSDAVYRSDEGGARLDLAAGGSSRSPARRGIGGNGGPPLDPILDPMTLAQTFPGLASAPAGAILAAGNDFLDITGPGQALTTAMSRDYSNTLINQIRALDPAYRYESLGFPTTTEGQINQINDLRFDRAVALARVTGDLRPMQVETARVMQRTADKAYDDGMALLQAGKLAPKLSPNEALGNYIDKRVRAVLRYQYDSHDLDEASNPSIRVNRNEADSSADERTFRRPDARVGNVAFDVTLTRKTLGTAQVRGFFGADFKPDQVVIIRPSQLGADSSYIITRPNVKQLIWYEVKMSLDNVVAGRFPGSKVYIPGSLSEIVDFLAPVLGASPTFEKMKELAPYLNIDTTFETLERGLGNVREKLGEETYAKLMGLSARMKTLFLEDQEETNGKTMQGIRLIHEMTDILDAVRDARVKARLPDEEGRITGD